MSVHTAHGAYDGGHTASMQPTPAHAVGSQFVQQFYTVLHSSPKYLHRFYTNASTMTHADAERSPPEFTVQSQDEINRKVIELGFDEAVTEIWSVDSQYSAGDGVIVQVTGCQQCKNKPRRNFVQTFFLAVQEKGYFVLNDLFRYLPEPVAAQPPQSAAAPAPAAAQEDGYYGAAGGAAGAPGGAALQAQHGQANGPAYPAAQQQAAMGPPQPQPPPAQAHAAQAGQQRSGALMPFNFLLMPEMASLQDGSLPLPAAGGGGGDPAQRTLAEVLDMKAFSTEH